MCWPIFDFKLAIVENVGIIFLETYILSVSCANFLQYFISSYLADANRDIFPQSQGKPGLGNDYVPKRPWDRPFK